MTTTDRRFVRPGIERVTTDGGRWYEWDDIRYPSVTTIERARGIGYGLKVWYVNTTAEYAVANPDADYNDIRTAADRYRDERADKGSMFHAYAEAWVKEEPQPEPEDPELVDMVRWFHHWLDAMSPKFLLAEAPVFNKALHYAGTLDAVVELNSALFDDEQLAVLLHLDTWDVAKWRLEHGGPVRVVLDYTTGKYVFPSKALQVCAYRHAEWVGMPDGTKPRLFDTDGGAVLQVRADGWWLYPVDTSESVFDAFRSIREVYDWETGLSKDVLGKPTGSDNE